MLDKDGNTYLPGQLNVSHAIVKYLFLTEPNRQALMLYQGSGGHIIIKDLNPSTPKYYTLWSPSQTVTHRTNLIGELGTFCEATGYIYDGYEKISNTDCICAVKQSTSLNKKIVGIICSEDEFASHGDVLVRVNDITGLEVGDILCPDQNGFGKKANEAELMMMVLHAIPRPKITSLDSGIEGYVACFLV